MTVRVERDGPVTTVIMDRPDVRNAVDGPTAAALAGAFRAFDADDGAHVAVLWGAGGTFCSGADLKAIGGPDGNRAEPDGDGPMGPTRMRLAKPVIAAIAGHAVAGGLELALWCDLRVAEEDAVLGVFCRRWGVPLIDGGTVRLPRVVGLGRALARRGPRRRPWPTRSPHCPSSACAATGRPRWRAAGSVRTRRWPTSSATA
jgi:enoyl-CoA hydratase